MAGIKRVWGTVDGTEYEFQRVDGRWQIRVPASPRGYYTMQLWAEDLAGNVGFMAELATTIDLRTLSATFSILKLGARFSMQNIQTLLVATGPNEK